MNLKKILNDTLNENVPEIDLEIPYDYKRKLKLTISEIRDYYPILGKNGTPWMIALYENVCNEQLLTEFTARTIEKKITISHLKQRFSKYFSRYYTKLKGEEGLWIEFKEDKYQYIKEVNKFMESFGWYPAFILDNEMPYTIDFNKFNILNSMTINYMEKFDSINDMKGYDYIYHVTPDIALKKIEENGLTPKNKSKLSNNPERIYFLLPTNENNIIATIKGLHAKATNKSLIKSWYILKINFKQLPEFIIFYNDPVFKIGDGAVWTFENIPPKFIEKIKKVNLK